MTPRKQLNMMLPAVILLQALLLSESFTLPPSSVGTGSSRSTTAVDMYNGKNVHVHVVSSSSPFQTTSTSTAPVQAQRSTKTLPSSSSSSSSSSLFVLKATSSDENENESNNKQAVEAKDNGGGLPTYGGLIGTITGLSLSAIRQSVRTTTGLSLTATRTALRGLTGVSVTASMKMLFGIFPPWFRYFLQPFFIAYYTPLMIMKYFLLGSTKTSKKEALASHEKVIEGWKDAIRAAEQAKEYWPLHVTDDGRIESLTPQSVPITDVIVESIDVASTIQNKSTK